MPPSTGPTARRISPTTHRHPMPPTVAMDLPFQACQKEKKKKKKGCAKCFSNRDHSFEVVYEGGARERYPSPTPRWSFLSPFMGVFARPTVWRGCINSLQKICSGLIWKPTFMASSRLKFAFNSKSFPQPFGMPSILTFSAWEVCDGPTDCSSLKGTLLTVDFRVYPFQSTVRTALYANILFARFIAFMKFESAMEWAEDVTSDLCTGFNGQRPDVRNYFQCQDFCQMRYQKKKTVYGFQVRACVH